MRAVAAVARKRTKMDNKTRSETRLVDSASRLSLFANAFSPASPRIAFGTVSETRCERARVQSRDDTFQELGSELPNSHFACKKWPSKQIGEFTIRGLTAKRLQKQKCPCPCRACTKSVVVSLLGAFSFLVFWSCRGRPSPPINYYRRHT